MQKQHKKKFLVRKNPIDKKKIVMKPKRDIELNELDWLEALA